jgi:hypothetical protein
MMDDIATQAVDKILDSIGIQLDDFSIGMRTTKVKTKLFEIIFSHSLKADGAFKIWKR